MATRPLRAGDLPEDALIFEAEDAEATEAEVEENEQLNNLLADLGDMDDVKIHVYRANKGSAVKWVDSFAPSEMDIEQLMVGLRDNYGGGRFKIQVREKGKIRKQKMIEIEPLPDKPVVDQEAILRELKAEQQKESGGMAEIFARMMEANQQQSQHQAEQMQSFMSTVVSAFADNNKQTAPSMSETITAVAELHKLSAPVKQTDPTEMILKGIELANAVRGDGDGEANMYSVMSSAMKTFGSTLSDAMKTAPMPAQVAAPTESGEQLPPQMLENLPTLPTDHPLARFEPYVDYMISLAVKGSNPELYGEVIIDQLGPELAHAWLATPEGLETLASQLPKVRPHLDWLRRVGVVVDQLTTFDETDAPGSHQDGDVRKNDGPAEIADNASPDGDSERPGGDPGDAAGDGQAGDPG